MCCVSVRCAIYYGLSDSKIVRKERKGFISVLWWRPSCRPKNDYAGTTSISSQHFISGGNAFNLSSNQKLSGFCVSQAQINKALVIILNIICRIKELLNLQDQRFLVFDLFPGSVQV